MSRVQRPGSNEHGITSWARTSEQRSPLWAFRRECTTPSMPVGVARLTRTCNWREPGSRSQQTG